MRASVRHEAAIPEGAERVGFYRKLAKYCNVFVPLRDRFLPDGFVFEFERRRLTIYEVEVTHPVDERKLAKIRLLRSVMRSLGWMLRPMHVAFAGSLRPMDMRTGQGVVSRREGFAAVGALGRRSR